MKVKKINYEKIIYIGLSLYTLCLFLMHFIRVFDNNYWADEAFTVNTIKAGFFEMINITASDVHPPLYYIFVWIFSEVFGYSGVVYHLVSLIPYGIMLLIGITVIYKWFGKETTFVFVSFASLLSTSIQMSVEIRMYSWGVLFVLISFLILYKILKENKTEYWCVFVVSSLAAAYTHYYCLVSVAFFYLILILDTLIRNKVNLKKMIVTCVVTVLCYLPWFFVLLETFQRTTDSFWQTELQDLIFCFEYLFYSKLGLLFFAIFVIAVVVWLIVEFRKKKIGSAHVDYDELIWVLAGISSIFGTMILGYIVSILIRPMFIARYLFPVSVVAWLLLGFCLSRFKWKSIYVAILGIMIIGTGVPEYYNTYVEETISNQKLEETLDVTVSEIKKDDIILSDNIYIIWAVSETYYPGVKCESTTDMFNRLEKDRTYWLILNNPIDENQKQSILDLGMQINPIKEDGVIGTYPVSIYKIFAVTE